MGLKIKNKGLMFAVLAVIIQIIVLLINYRMIDINYPLTYADGDGMGVFYYAKMIDEFGISLENPMTGGPNGSNMYDYPYSDSLSFSIVKLISLFSNNPFLIINVFYFLCSIITTLTAYYVLNKHSKHSIISMVLAVLYANSPYFQFRYEHMWLIPYFMIPLECDIALDILEGNIVNDDVPIYKNSFFYRSLGVAFLCAFTGLYYAFFACALFAMAMVIRMLMTSKIKGNLYPIGFIILTIIGCGINFMPNLLYYRQYGTNPLSETSLRQGSDAEIFGLKLVQLLLPRALHRIGFLSNINSHYANNYPLVNENGTASLGLIASAGFIIALCWLFTNKEKKEKSYLIIATFLVATIGGLSSVLSMLVTMPMRCYNRMSLVIMFLSLMCVGDVLMGFCKHIPKICGLAVVLIVLVVGVFDQTVTVYPIDKTIIDDQRSFVENIENTMENDDLIYELPYVSWPSGGNYRMFVGYLFSHNLRWSFGAMQGREESEWQIKTVSKSPSKMIKRIAKRGYKGLFLDTVVYERIYGEGTAAGYIDQIREVLGQEQISNSDNTLLFWNLNDYIDKNLDDK